MILKGQAEPLVNVYYLKDESAKPSTSKSKWKTVALGSVIFALIVGSLFLTLKKDHDFSIVESKPNITMNPVSKLDAKGGCAIGAGVLGSVCIGMVNTYNTYSILVNEQLPTVISLRRTLEVTTANKFQKLFAGSTSSAQGFLKLKRLLTTLNKIPLAPVKKIMDRLLPTMESLVYSSKSVNDKLNEVTDDLNAVVSKLKTYERVVSIAFPAPYYKMIMKVPSNFRNIPLASGTCSVIGGITGAACGSLQKRDFTLDSPLALAINGMGLATEIPIETITAAVKSFNDAMTVFLTAFDQFETQMNTYVNGVNEFMKVLNPIADAFDAVLETKFLPEIGLLPDYCPSGTEFYGSGCYNSNYDHRIYSRTAVCTIAGAGPWTDCGRFGFKHGVWCPPGNLNLIQAPINHGMLLEIVCPIIMVLGSGLIGVQVELNIMLLLAMVVIMTITFTIVLQCVLFKGLVHGLTVGDLDMFNTCSVIQDIPTMMDYVTMVYQINCPLRIYLKRLRM